MYEYTYQYTVFIFKRQKASKEAVADLPLCPEGKSPRHGATEGGDEEPCVAERLVVSKMEPGVA